jgi:hypothetical protein
MKTRLFAILPSSATSSKVKHFIGLPPELTAHEEARQEMGKPCFLLIKEESSGIFLYRYDAKGKCVGDTWHKSVDDAKHQATYEYENFILDWEDVPSEVKDIVNYGLTCAIHPSKND